MVLEFLLDGASQRPGTEFFIGAILDKVILGLLGEFEFQAPLGESGSDLGDFQVDDFDQIVVPQFAEDDQLVDSVDELGAEVFFHFALEHVLHFVVADIFVAFLEAERCLVDDAIGADVAGHDEDDVFEIDVSPEGVGESAFFHDLEEHVEDFGVGFFDFVEQDDGVGSSPDALGELPAFFVADVSWRGAD